MPEKKTLRIFISYGHDEHAGLAERIKNDLEERGHEVWFDRDRIKPGKDFELYIEDGLKWLTEDKSRARFLYLMTPHSVRRPDGFCLNELTSAMMKELSIFPVMVQMSEPPLSICRIQWLDMQECFPSCENTPYSVKFERLLAALEDRNWDFEGFEKNLLKVFNPIDFGPDMLRHLKDFTGREWLKKEIEEWLEGKRPGSKQVFWIKGKPGIGKTAISSWLASTMYEVVAVHFFRSDSSEKRDPVRFIHTLVYYLSTQIPEYREQLEVLPQPVEHYLQEYKNDPNDLFYNLVILPLHRAGMKDRKTLAVVIDGLDEASEESGDNEIARLIARQLEKAPSWLKFIVTSRSEAGINAELQGVTNPCELDSASEENEKDIREYLEMKLKPYLEEEMDEEKIILEILQKSEGLFVYVNAFIKALEEKALTLKDVGNFPGKLGEIYYTYFSSKFKDEDDYGENVSPVLELILATVEPPDIELLAEVLGHKGTQILRIIRKLGSLFERNENRMIPFHSTLSEWLASENGSFKYYVSEKEGHKRLAEYGLEKYRKVMDREEYETEKDYAVKNLGIHLYEAGMDEELEELLKEIAESSEEKGWKTVVFFNVCDHVIERYDFDKEEKLKRIIRELPVFSTEPLARISGDLYIKHANRARDLWCLLILEKVASTTEAGADNENLEYLGLLPGLFYSAGVLELNLIGKGIKALEYHEKSLGILENLLDKYPDSERWQLELSQLLSYTIPSYLLLGNDKKTFEYGRRSLEILEKLIEKSPEREDLLNSISETLSIAGVECLIRGDFDRAYEYYKRRLEIAKNLMMKDPTNTDWQRLLLKTLSDEERYLLHGKDNWILDYLNTLDIDRILVDEKPDDIHSQMALFESLGYLGKIYEKLGENNKALEYYMRCLEIIESLIDKDPEITHWQSSLGDSFGNVGRIHGKLGEIEKAIAYYRRELKIREILADREPSNRNSQHSLSGTLYKLGEVLEKLGKNDEALGYYITSLEILENIVQEDPSVLANRNLLEQGFQIIGGFFRRIGEDKKALEYYIRSLQLMENQRDMGIFSWILPFNTLHAISEIHKNLGEESEAINYLKRLEEILECAVREKPDLLAHQIYFLSIVLHEIGELYDSLGDKNEALNYYLRALEKNEKLANNNNRIDESKEEADRENEELRWFNLRSNSVIDQQQFLHFKMAETYEGLGENDKAMEYFLRGLEITENLLEKVPENFDLQLLRLGRLVMIGKKYKNLGETGKALECYMRCLEINEELLEKYPEKVDLQIGLWARLNELGGIYEELGEDKIAIDYYMRSVEISESLLKKEPIIENRQLGLYLSIFKTGDTYVRLGENQKAIKCYHIERTLLEKEPETPLRRTLLAHALVNISRLTEEEKEKNECIAEATSITRSLIDSGVENALLDGLRKFLSI